MSCDIIEVAKQVCVELLSSENTEKATPLFLKNRTLTITCSTQSAAQEIRQKQQEIIDKINQKCEKNEVDRIRYLL